MVNRGIKLTQNQLFAAILIELCEALGGALSTEQLIEAASQLTKLIEKDFGLNEPIDRAYKANYFTHDTFSAIQTMGWLILSAELGIEHLDDEILNPQFLRNRLRDLGVGYD